MAKGGELKGSGHLHQKPAFQYLIALLTIATLIVSTLAFVNIYQIKKILVPKAINVSDFLKKLTSHAEMKGYAGVTPLNVIQINNNNIANLQSQINGLDMSFIGNFIVQYPDKVAIYDYERDIVRSTVNLQQQVQLPSDLFTKLNKHSELQGLQNEKPISGQLDENSLKNLKQQFPDVYANAKAGDFLLRYKTKLIIYDYNRDKIINSASLS